MRWKGYTEEEDSWEQVENLTHCAEAVERYELSQAGISAIADVTQETGPWVFGTTDGSIIQLDLNGEESIEDIVTEICNRAHIKREDVVLAWASPPCETYSRANWANLSRGHNHRQPVQGWPPVTGEKGKKAQAHDRLVKRVMQMLELFERSVMENPRGGLEHMPFMRDWDTRKKTVDLCAFLWPFLKGTNLWVKGFDWAPTGVTGDGRCRRKCGQGEEDLRSGKFRHYMARAVDPQRGARGGGSTKWNCVMPVEMMREIVTATLKGVHSENKVVLDLCAGFGSMKQAAEEAGAKYVGVDIRGQRKLNTQIDSKRKVAVVLVVNKQLMAVKVETDASKHKRWRMAIGQQTDDTESLQQTGVRQLDKELGVSEHNWRKVLTGGPDVFALPRTTYYVYHLNALPQQEPCAEATWVPVQRLTEGRSSSGEDAEFVRRFRAGREARF